MFSNGWLRSFVESLFGWTVKNCKPLYRRSNIRVEFACIRNHFVYTTESNISLLDLSKRSSLSLKELFSFLERRLVRLESRQRYVGIHSSDPRPYARTFPSFSTVSLLRFSLPRKCRLLILRKRSSREAVICSLYFRRRLRALRRSV